MKKIFFILFLLLPGVTSFAQISPERYNELLKKADRFYRLKNYKTSAQTYSQAFKLNRWKATTDDRYNAACAWAMAGIPDSAYFQLGKVIENGKYYNYQMIATEPAFKSLQKEKRWELLLENVQQNAKNAEAKLNKPLIWKLDSINTDDQQYRVRIDDTKSAYGADSKELKELWQQINKTDSINLIKVKAILDRDGWLGPDIVGLNGNTTLFLVIQHSDLKTQEHYLPMMREAVKNGNAQASALALLEDRVALGEGKKQIYGSQIITDPKTGKDTIAPVEDFPNVDKRRAAVGLEPLQEYVNHWGIVLKPRAPKKKAEPVYLNGDFETATEIHDSIIGPVNVCKGTGNHIDFTLPYGYGELTNSAWFKFTMDLDTLLIFDIVPDYPREDYDFFLFKCPDGDCMNKIRKNEVKADRFCYSVNFDKNSSTGLSESATNMYLGSGYAPSGYVTPLPVKAGETYYLMVACSYPNSKGFTIYFYNYWPQKPKALHKRPAKLLAAPVILENVLFESNKTILLKESGTALDKLVELLQKNKSMTIEIRGHTDNTGDEKTNQKLSEARAKKVVDYLVSKKIEKERLSYKGFGSTQPVASNDNEEGKKKNRRVEFLVVKK
ncbi:MAG: hypothetical protein JWP12_1777 [Bacteroidetes bacterium]|nr:hypothetical protein [Bacteroidota bacterium]